MSLIETMAIKHLSATHVTLNESDAS